MPSGNSEYGPHHPRDPTAELVTPAQLRHASAELELVRRRRELLFWTIRMTLAVVVLIAITIALLWSLIHGSGVDVVIAALAAGIAGGGVKVKERAATVARQLASCD